MMTIGTAHGSAVLTHDVGLHARPSVKLTKAAKAFASSIELALSPDDPWIDAKSIVKMMATKAKKHAVLHFRASGRDAHAAVTALTSLVERDFEENHADAPTG
jgi:phosphocarrier protein HPr